MDNQACGVPSMSCLVRPPALRLLCRIATSLHSTGLSRLRKSSEYSFKGFELKYLSIQVLVNIFSWSANVKLARVVHVPE